MRNQKDKSYFGGRRHILTLSKANLLTFRFSPFGPLSQGPVWLALYFQVLCASEYCEIAILGQGFGAARTLWTPLGIPCSGPTTMTTFTTATTTMTPRLTWLVGHVSSTYSYSELQNRSKTRCVSSFDLMVETKNWMHKRTKRVWKGGAKRASCLVSRTIPKMSNAVL